MLVGIHNNREWARFCTTVLRRLDLVEDSRFQSNALRVEHRAAMDLEIEQVVCDMTAADVITLLDEAQIANARLSSVSQFIDHPQLAARNVWRQVDSPVGPIPALIPPVHMEGVEPVMGAIPELGQHSVSILQDLGFDAATIAQWKQDGVI